MVSENWDGFGIRPEIWATLIIIVALAITLLFLATRRDIAYSLVIDWALVAIAVKQSGNQSIATLTEASAIIVLLALAAATLFGRFNGVITRTEREEFLLNNKRVCIYEICGTAF